MPVDASVTLPNTNQVTPGQTADGQVVIYNGTADPVTISSISVYSMNPSAGLDAIRVDLGAGAGGAAATVPAGISTVNSGVSVAYPFSTQAYAAQVPGASTVAIQIGATVVLSDGTVIGAQPASLVVVPLLTVTADSVNAAVNNLSTNVATSVPSGAFQFHGSQNSGLEIVEDDL